MCWGGYIDLTNSKAKDGTATTTSEFVTSYFGWNTLVLVGRKGVFLTSTSPLNVSLSVKLRVTHVQVTAFNEKSM